MGPGGRDHNELLWHQRSFGRFYLPLTKILLQLQKAHTFCFTGDFRPPFPHKSNGIELLLFFLHWLYNIHNK